jgi:hypothetical protein
MTHNVSPNTAVGFAAINDSFSRGKKNGATSIPPKADAPLAQIIYQQRERRSAYC